jgi:hypothetical protein
MTATGSSTGVNPAERGSTLLKVALIVAIGVLVAKYGLGQVELRKEKARLNAELAALEQAQEAELQREQERRRAQFEADEAAHQARLRDEAFLSGALAQEKRAEEWRRRNDHEAELVKSPLERTLLTMARIGGDTAVTAQDALRQVAEMGAPPGSRVVVEPAGKGFIVRVAFKLSQINYQESGAVTRHTSTDSMRREIRVVSARLMKQLFDFCGSRGIVRLAVSCNRTLREADVPPGATEVERQALLRKGALIMRCVYRTSIDGDAARSVTNWRSLSLSKVMQMLQVEHDGIDMIQISSRTAVADADAYDPNMQLEF